MTQSSDEHLHPRVGRFVVELGSERRTGLAAHEVVALLKSPQGRDAAIYRIHRVDDAGRLELIGVQQSLFSREDCLLFTRSEPAGAREDFQAIRSLASEMPPPCRAEVQLADVPERTPPSVVALIFPAACTESLGHWLQQASRQPGDRAEGGSHALQAYRDAGPRILESAVLEPR